MKKIAFILLMTLWAAPLCAETYSWVDDRGTMNFTEDLGSVPKKFRKNARKLGYAEPLAAPAPKPGDSTAIKPEDGSKTGIFAGKSFDEWKKDFEEREAAMKSVKNQLDEIIAKTKNKDLSREDQERLVAEHKKLLEQFNEMKVSYNEQVEIARKGGLQISVK